jgi:hypothetical protein
MHARAKKKEKYSMRDMKMTMMKTERGGKEYKNMK